MTTSSPGAGQRSLRSWPQDALRIGFGLIWMVDATLKWLPGFRTTYVTQVTGVAAGQPLWLKWWFDFWVELQQPRPTLFAYAVATIETLVALAIILGFARKVAYLASAAYGLGLWTVAEGFGGPYATGHTDVGAGIVYTVVSLGLLALCYYAGGSRLSVDYYLERRITWWWRVAEMHSPNAARTAPSVDLNASFGFERQINIGDSAGYGIANASNDAVARPAESIGRRRQ